MREAQVLASLNHPNIAAIYGLEENAIVMELVEGEELKGPLPLDEALRIAKQIADALEAAHERGIIHRVPRGLSSTITAQVPDLGPPNASPSTATLPTGCDRARSASRGE